MINLYTNYEVATLTHYEDMKGNKNAKIGVVWRYPKVISNITV